jgi:NADH-quinone oxidoreductase subunit L
MLDTIALVPSLPLLGAVINALFGRKLDRRSCAILSCSTVGLSFLLSIIIFLQFIPDAGTYHIVLYRWFSVGNLKPEFGIGLDSLSMVMTLLVSGIGFLVHVYSARFMNKDEDYFRYFAYLNLFIFFMLTLVLADNLLVLFFGWEGVGLCSYLLIGFWYEDEANARAGKKAFIVTRFGDIGLIAAILVIFTTFGSLEYSYILPLAGTLERDGSLAVVITALLLLGAIGKSAQLPLQAWLPDAMKGPTPVSALIHSATMVAAGVFLIARMSPFYRAAPSTSAVLAAIGILTAIYGATSAIAQGDIKRVLAYSTISQLGLMFFALGLGAYSIAMFHLLSQAFFKSLLFLATGCLIMATKEHDIFKMKVNSPLVFWTFLAGALSLAAVPGTAGFFSKEAILFAAYGSGSYIYWPLVVFSSFLTSLYIFRVFFAVFFRAKNETWAPPTAMITPMLVLSVFAIFWGYAENSFDRFMEPVLVSNAIAIEDMARMALTAAAAISTLAGIFTAYLLYVSRQDLPDRIVLMWQRSYTTLREGYFFDRIYETIVSGSYYRLSAYIWKTVDVGMIDRSIDISGRFYRRWADRLWLGVDIRIVDGFVNGLANLTLASSRALRVVQTGLVRDYAIPMAGGVALLVLYFLML